MRCILVRSAVRSIRSDGPSHARAAFVSVDRIFRPSRVPRPAGGPRRPMGPNRADRFRALDSEYVVVAPGQSGPVCVSAQHPYPIATHRCRGASCDATNRYDHSRGTVSERAHRYTSSCRTGGQLVVPCVRHAPITCRGCSGRSSRHIPAPLVCSSSPAHRSLVEHPLSVSTLGAGEAPAAAVHPPATWASAAPPCTLGHQRPCGGTNGRAIDQHQAPDEHRAEASAVARPGRDARTQTWPDVARRRVLHSA